MQTCFKDNALCTKFPLITFAGIVLLEISCRITVNDTESQSDCHVAFAFLPAV